MVNVFKDLFTSYKVTRYLKFSRHYRYCHHSSSVAAYLVYRNLIVCFSSGISLRCDLQSHGCIRLNWKCKICEN